MLDNVIMYKLKMCNGDIIYTKEADIIGTNHSNQIVFTPITGEYGKEILYFKPHKSMLIFHKNICTVENLGVYQIKGE